MWQYGVVVVADSSDRKIMINVILFQWEIQFR